MPELTFENLRKCVVANGTDPEAWFMWNALAIVASAPGYNHLEFEEVFEHLKECTIPKTREVLQLVKELETKNEDIPTLCCDVDGFYNFHHRFRGR